MELHLPHTFGFPSRTTAGQQGRTAGQGRSADSRRGRRTRSRPTAPTSARSAPLCSAPFPCSATAAPQRCPAAYGPAALPVWLSRGLPLPLPAHGHTDGRRSSLSPTEATSDPTTQRRTTCAALAEHLGGWAGSTVLGWVSDGELTKWCGWGKRAAFGEIVLLSDLLL